MRTMRLRLWLRRWALNRFDLILGLAVAFATTSAVTVTIFSGALGKEIASAILAGWVAILLAAIGAAIKITSTGQSLISLLSSELKALQYGLATMTMFEFWKVVHTRPEEGAWGFADTPRDEDYFQIFHSVGNNIGNLHPEVVEAIVRFYTYLKMSRDAAAALHSWKEKTDRELRKMNVKRVVHLLTLSMLWGFVALWFMGFKAQKHDHRFRATIKDAYDTVLGSGEFDQLLSEYSRKAELGKFFSD